MIEPIIWETYGSVEIRELGNEDIDQLVHFVIGCQLEDSLSHPIMIEELMYETYTDFYKYALSKKESLIAVDRRTGEVVGVVVCLFMTAKMKSWVNLRLTINDARIKLIFNLIYLMMFDAQRLEPNMSEYVRPEDLVHVLRIAVPREHKQNNWKPRLLNAVSKMATCVKMPCVTYLAFTINDQIRAERAGMKEQIRVYYLQYVDPETRIRPFILTRQDELCCILYKKDVDVIISYSELRGPCLPPKRIKSSRRYYKLPSISSSIYSEISYKTKEKKKKVLKLQKIRVKYSSSDIF